MTGDEALRRQALQHVPAAVYSPIRRRARA